MALEIPPALADRGFWSVVPVTGSGVEFVGGDPPRDPFRPAVTVGPGWCAFYDADRVVIREPDPRVGLDTLNVDPMAVLADAGWSSLPRGRVGER